MKYWLLKTEPEEYSFADLLRDKTTAWTGVRNYAARINLRAMKKGDLCFIYHSVSDKEIVGIAEITKEAYADPTNETKVEWVAVDMRPVSALKNKISLAQLKADHFYDDLELIRISRLSVVPVEKKHWDAIMSLGGE